ncbi:MAG: helix-turn-helix domain-containing protein [Pirellulales bacterium]
MTTLAIALKDEIRRLARKEIKAQTGRTSRAVAQYRREIARLKRQQRDQEKKLAFLTAQTRKSIASPAAAAHELNGDSRFSARSVKAQRRRSGLSAADYAKLVGVSPLTIYNWEHNKSHPRREQFTSLVALRGLGKREAQAKLGLLAAAKKPATIKRAAKPAAKRGRPRRAK